MMTFAQFQASGRAVKNLAAVEHCAAQGAAGPGRVYANDLYIERAGPRGWCLTLGNDSRIDALPTLERRLYDWAVAEGYLA